MVRKTFFFLWRSALVCVLCANPALSLATQAKVVLDSAFTGAPSDPDSGGGRPGIEPVRSEVFGIVGDGGLWTSQTEMVRNAMAARKTLRLILPGDNNYNPSATYGDIWNPWKAFGFKFEVVALGNHTLGYPEEMAFFNMPGEYYSYRTESSRFLVLNSDNKLNIQEQEKWFEKQISRAKDKFLFVVFHHSPYTITDRHGWQERKDFHLRFRPLLQKYKSKITALIVGHDHLAGIYTLNGLPMIVSGAIFETYPAPEVVYTEDGVTLRTHWVYNGNPHWVNLEVFPEAGNVWLNFVDARTRQVTCSIQLNQGRLFKRKNCYQR